MHKVTISVLQKILYMGNEYIVFDMVHEIIKQLWYILKVFQLLLILVEGS